MSRLDPLLPTRRRPDPEKIDPLIFLPGVQWYGKLGELIAKAFRVGKE